MVLGLVAPAFPEILLKTQKLGPDLMGQNLHLISSPAASRAHDSVRSAVLGTLNEAHG